MVGALLQQLLIRTPMQQAPHVSCWQELLPRRAPFSDGTNHKCIARSPDFKNLPPGALGMHTHAASPSRPPLARPHTTLIAPRWSYEPWVHEPVSWFQKLTSSSSWHTHPCSEPVASAVGKNSHHIECLFLYITWINCFLICSSSRIHLSEL